MQASELKRLQTERSNVAARLEQSVQQEKATREALTKCQAAIAGLRADLKRIEASMAAPKELVVSEHAMLRYVERVIGITPDKLAEMVLPEAVRTQQRELGDGTYDCGSHKVRVAGGVVVTVI